MSLKDSFVDFYHQKNQHGESLQIRNARNSFSKKKEKDAVAHIEMSLKMYVLIKKSISI